MEQRKKIVCIHLLNNFSGSPKVLKYNIENWINKGFVVTLITNKSYGFLSNIDGLEYELIDYSWSSNKIATLIRYLWAQIQIFLIIIVKYRNKNVIIYINTLLPIAAAIASKMINKKNIYHVHEYYVKKSFISELYTKIFYLLADEAIYVSNYLKSKFEPVKINSHVVHNGIELTLDSIYNIDFKARFYITFISSLKKYKGIYQFLEISSRMPDKKFKWVLDCSQKDLDIFLLKNPIPKNVIILRNCNTLNDIFDKTKILLNLSIPELCVETFGLTILEAMSNGIPSIVPKVGGPIELINNGVNGFCENSNDIDSIIQKIDYLFDNTSIYKNMAINSYNASKYFSTEKCNQEIINIINHSQ